MDRRRILQRGLSRILSEENWTVENVADWARPWIEFLRAAARRHKGGSILPGDFLDCTPFNLIVNPAGGVVPFDLEYLATEPLDLAFVAFRGLWGSFVRQQTCALPALGTSRNAVDLVLAVMRHLGIQVSPGATTRWIETEARLQHEIVGTPFEQAEFMLRRQSIAVREATVIEPRVEVASTNRFLSQIFWRTRDGIFTEENSASAGGEITANRQTLQISIPPLAGEPFVLRWDMADHPGVLQVFALDLIDPRGRTLWSLSHCPGTSAFRSVEQAIVVPASPAAPATFLIAGTDPWVELATAGVASTSLLEGGTFLLDYAWAASPGSLHQLAAQLGLSRA